MRLPNQSMATGKGNRRDGKLPRLQKHKAPVLTMFFLWRLHSKPSHGYSLIEDVKNIGIVRCKPSTIYALLSSLEKDGLVKGRFDQTGEHLRKLFQTTPNGWNLLKETKKSKIRGLWREFVAFLLE